MKIDIGDTAPEFTLYDTNKSKVSLENFAGKNVILLFYPFAFSSTCTKELCEVRDHHSFFENLGTEVLGISVDSLYTNAKYKEVHNLNFPLLSDFNKEVSAEYDSLMDQFAFDYRCVSKRSVFLIDRNRRIAYMEILPSPGDYPDMTKLRGAVESLESKVKE